MPSRIGRIVKISLMLLVAASPLATHFVLTSGEWGIIADVLILSQISLALWLVLTRLRRPYKEPAAVGLLACGVVLCVLHWSGGLVLSAGLPHALAYLALLTVFGTSLLPGRVPICTLLSHQIHGALPAAIDRYTRRATWAWAL